LPIIGLGFSFFGNTFYSPLFGSISTVIVIIFPIMTYFSFQAKRRATIKFLQGYLSLENDKTIREGF